MANQFDYFVILAGMRTGSNYLESSLNAYAGIECLGEVFNPHFVGFPKKNQLYGFDLKQREANPLGLVEQIKSKTAGVPGFRFFFDHDPRVLDACLADRRCAKIILTRNLLDTYVSREIARETNQWRLGKMQDARTAKIRFEKDAYLAHVTKNQGFLAQTNRSIQTTGQTAFQIHYDDLSDTEIMNGLACYLGVSDKKKNTSAKTKKQNPGSLKDKVQNFDDMAKALGDVLVDALDNEQSFEPPRGPAIPTYVPAPESPLLFMPIKSGPTEIVRRWLANLDGLDSNAPDHKFNQKELRRWKRKARNHRSFTVIRHPVPRLHDAFVRRILMPGDQSFPAIRNALKTGFGVPLPAYDEIPKMDAKAHLDGFLAFAEFVQGNLNGQTSIRVDAAWASQTELLLGDGRV